jgi:S1-C subfamily serine protease
MPCRLALVVVAAFLVLINPAQPQDTSLDSAGRLLGRLIQSSDTQTTAPALMSEQIIEKASPSVALVLVGKSSSELECVGSALVVRSNGVLLTAYHLIKDAKALQIRFKSGEIFDDVQLLGVDRRRDVAAVKIAASALPAPPVGSASTVKAGDPVYVVSHAAILPWTASTGIISAYRLADEVPGAGSGYRLLQFTASASPGSSGGVLLDGQARALGLIVGTLEGGQNLNFAVPIENVLGLIDAPIAQTYASGAALQLPATKDNVNATVASPPSSSPQPQRTEVQSEELTRSEVLKSRDPDFILRNFRTLYVDTRKAQFFGDTQMKAALGKNKEFTAMRIAMVDDPSLADVVLEVAYTFMWDYPFSLKHQNTSIVLVAGKGAGPFSGPAGATSVARELAKLLKPYRTAPPSAKGSTK